MRRRIMRVCLVVVSFFVLLAIVFAASRSEPQSSTPHFERLGPQNEAKQEAQQPLKPVGPQRDPIVTLPVAFGTIASLKDLPAGSYQTSAALSRAEEPEPPRLYAAVNSGPDAVAQLEAGTINMPSPIANFDGISLADQGISLSPPDTNGDIGYDPATGKRYYFQWVNVAYKAWDVTNPAAPVVVLPLTLGNALWQAALPGSPCAETNDGDPIVLFDEQAQRWLISQFSLGPSYTGPFHQCIAVSQTGNPASGWYVYDYAYRDASTYLNDYPHFSVWPDATNNAYLMTVHEFDAFGTSYLGQSASAFDRARLLNGDSTAPLVTFSLGTNYFGMLAADLDGPPPASGTPGFFFMTTPAGTLQIWEFRPDWTTPANSIFGVGAGHTSNYTLTVAPYTDCSTSLCAVVPQSGTSQLLDSLGDRLMHRVAFRVLGGITQTVVLNHTVEPDSSIGSTRTGIRWYELRRNPASGAWSVNQQSTYAPGSTDYRWMGSIATDRAGNIALGYSASSSSSFPSIRYAGRLFTDTLSLLPRAEVTMTVGLGAQTSSRGRWGDYSMMGVDPQDGCTFWYTQEYYASTASVAWKTRIGSFKFPECTPASNGTLSGTVHSSSNNNPIPAASVTAIDGLGATHNTASDGSGVYRLIGLPIGTYTVTAAAGGYSAGSVSGVSIAAGVTTTQDLSLTPLAQADLSLIKTASATTIAPGGLLTYTLNISNHGPNAIASTVTVTDMLPAGYVLNDATGAGWACSGTSSVICTRKSLNVAAPTRITITGVAPVTVGPLVNSSTVSAAVIDAATANNTSAVTVTVVPQTDLAITKTGPVFAAPGATLVYALNVSNNGPLSIGTFTTTFANSAVLNIPDNFTQMVTSTITVADLPSVQRAQASLLGFTHPYPEDIDVLLVGPGGQTTILMSDPRGGANPANNIDLQFDDKAAPILCTSGVLAAGTYHPTDCPNVFGNDTFPSPAPAGPYTATLSVFNLANPNGTWKLFARDDSSTDIGSINRGWTLTLMAAYGLTVTDMLPAGTTFIGAKGDGWNCAQASGVVTCTRDTLALGAAPGIAITVTAPLTPGLITNVAQVESDLLDNGPMNNTAQLTTNITTVYSVFLPIVFR